MKLFFVLISALFLSSLSLNSQELYPTPESFMPEHAKLIKDAKKGDHWLREPIIVNDSFIDLSGSNTLTLAKHFDAILLLKDISPPEK